MLPPRGKPIIRKGGRKDVGGWQRQPEERLLLLQRQEAREQAGVNSCAGWTSATRRLFHCCSRNMVAEVDGMESFKFFWIELIIAGRCCRRWMTDFYGMRVK